MVGSLRDFMGFSLGFGWMMLRPHLSCVFRNWIAKPLKKRSDTNDSGGGPKSSGTRVFICEIGAGTGHLQSTRCVKHCQSTSLRKSRSNPTRSGWWFGTWILWLSIQLGIMIPIPTDELILFRGVGQPPTSNGKRAKPTNYGRGIFQPCHWDNPMVTCFNYQNHGAKTTHKDGNMMGIWWECDWTMVLGNPKMMMNHNWSTNYWI